MKLHSAKEELTLSGINASLSLLSFFYDTLLTHCKEDLAWLK